MEKVWQNDGSVMDGSLYCASGKQEVGGYERVLLYEGYSLLLQPKGVGKCRSQQIKPGNQNRTNGVIQTCMLNLICFLVFFGHLEWKQAANTTLTHYHLIKQIKCVRKHKTTPTILGVPVSERALEPGHPMFYIFNLTLFTPVTVWIAPVNIMAPKQQFRGGVMCWAVR